MDIEQKAKRSKSLLENEWFIETIKNLREQQMSIFANSAPNQQDRREEAHGIICALNAIERELQSHVDAIKLITGKGKHREHD